MRVSKWILSLPALFLLSCAGTGYRDFYSEWRNVGSMNDAIALRPGEHPVVRESGNIENDYWDLLSDNYVCLGRSSFEGLYNGKGDIEDVAERIKATLAIYQIQYAKTVNLSSTTRLSKDGKTATTTSNDIDRYNHTAYYFVKSTSRGLIGIRYQDLEQADRERLRRNTGVVVSVVIKNSPAFYGNLIRGDVIIRMNGTDVYNVESLKQITKSLKPGDIVDVTVWRDGREASLVVKL